MHLFNAGEYLCCNNIGLQIYLSWDSILIVFSSFGFSLGGDQNANHQPLIKSGGASLAWEGTTHHLGTSYEFDLQRGEEDEQRSQQAARASLTQNHTSVSWTHEEAGDESFVVRTLVITGMQLWN